MRPRPSDIIVEGRNELQPEAYEFVPADRASEIAVVDQPSEVLDPGLWDRPGEGVKEGQAIAVVESFAKQVKAEPMHVEDLHDLAKAFPKETIDPSKPVREESLLLAGAMFALYQEDPEAFREGASAGFKKINYEGGLREFDQKSAGLNAAALAAIAGAGQDKHPARLVYRLERATSWQRFVYWGRDTMTRKLLPAFLRRGPEQMATDVAYWYVVRGCWHCLRVENGIARISARKDIPTDARPEDTLGDSWYVLRDVPQVPRAGSGSALIRNDLDLMAAMLGYRMGRFSWITRRHGLLLHEMGKMILDEAMKGYSDPAKGNGGQAQADNAVGKVLCSGMKWILVVGGMFAALAAVLYIDGG